MKELFTYYEGDLDVFIAESLITKDTLIKRVITIASDTLISDLNDKGVDIDNTFRHTLDNNAIRHVIKIHGSSNELLRGQIPITNSDLILIPEIVSSYDKITVDKNSRKQDVIIYTKAMEDGITFYVEEIRKGRRELAASSMYKRKKGDSPTLID